MRVARARPPRRWSRRLPSETPIAIPTSTSARSSLPSYALPSFTSDKDLEALLPDTIGGQVVIKQSLSGGIRNASAGGSASIDGLLAEVDATIDDVSVAIGVASDSVVVIAYQIDGVRAERIFDGFLTAVPSGAGGDVRKLRSAGESVTQVASPDRDDVHLPRGRRAVHRPAGP